MKRARPYKVPLRLACGHTRKVKPDEDWMRVFREPCVRCVQEARERLSSGS